MQAHRALARKASSREKGLSAAAKLCLCSASQSFFELFLHSGRERIAGLESICHLELIPQLSAPLCAAQSSYLMVSKVQQEAAKQKRNSAEPHPMRNVEPVVRLPPVSPPAWAAGATHRQAGCPLRVIVSTGNAWSPEQSVPRVAKGLRTIPQVVKEHVLQRASPWEAHLIVPEHRPPAATSPLPATPRGATPPRAAHRGSNTPPGLLGQARNHECWRARPGATGAAGAAPYLAQLMGAIHSFPVVIWTPAAKRDSAL